VPSRGASMVGIIVFRCAKMDPKALAVNLASFAGQHAGTLGHPSVSAEAVHRRP
jgi:hypothetical protein